MLNFSDSATRFSFETGSSTVPTSIIVRARHCYSVIDEQRDVFESHKHHIFSVAYYMTGNEMEAENILQSTFIRAFRRQPNPSPRPSIQQLDRCLMDELRSRLSLAATPAMQPQGVGLGGRNIRRTDLEEALWELPARERLCFLLQDVEGYSADRIAGLLEITESEVKRTVLSARLRIRSLLVAQRLTES